MKEDFIARAFLFYYIWWIYNYYKIYFRTVLVNLNFRNLRLSENTLLYMLIGF